MWNLHSGRRGRWRKEAVSGFEALTGYDRKLLGYVMNSRDTLTSHPDLWQWQRTTRHLGKSSLRSRSTGPKHLHIHAKSICGYIFRKGFGLSNGRICTCIAFRVEVSILICLCSENVLASQQERSTCTYMALDGGPAHHGIYTCFGSSPACVPGGWPLHIHGS